MLTGFAVFMIIFLAVGFFLTFLFDDSDVGFGVGLILGVVFSVPACIDSSRSEELTMAEKIAQCRESGMLWDQLSQSCINRHVQVKPNSAKAAAVPTGSDTKDDIQKYREAVKGCERAETRFKTYMYMGEPLDTAKKNDLELLIEKCEEGKI